MKVKISPEDREKLLGILPFDNDATEAFTPEIFNKFPKEIHPRYIIRPFKSNEKEYDIKYSLKMSRIIEKDKAYNAEKILPIQKDIMKIVSKALIDVENNVEIKSMEIKEVPKEDGHVSTEYFLDKIPTVIQNEIYRRIEQISGMIQSHLIKENLEEEKDTALPESPEKLGL